MSQSLILAGLMLMAAIPYAAVGHGGASAYIALMVLFGLAPAELRPTALILNIIVSLIAFVQFSRHKAFDWRLFGALAVLAVPAAYLAGGVAMDDRAIGLLLGGILLLSALMMLFMPRLGVMHATERRPFRLSQAMAAGGAFGVVGGLTGTGGGIFLGPLLLFARWADPRTTAGITSAFIATISLFGLAGNLRITQHLSHDTGLYALAVAAGGLIGSRFSARWLPQIALRRLLAIILCIAGARLISGAL